MELQTEHLEKKNYEQCSRNTDIIWTSILGINGLSDPLQYSLDDKNFEVEIDSKKNCPNYILSLRNTHEFRIKID